MGKTAALPNENDKTKKILDKTLKLTLLFT